MGAVTYFVLRHIVPALKISFKTEPGRRRWRRAKIDHVRSCDKQGGEFRVVKINAGVDYRDDNIR
jgi:hypothetical protein